MNPELESGLYVETIIYEIAVDGSHTTISRRLARTDFVPAAEAKGTAEEVGAKLATVLDAASALAVDSFKRNRPAALKA